ncbi:unnamed protein product [Notodromas monacha]|uniref:Uncharacterized protein n=1 Tax=Notodromas monacha TaxID=399045 RepID=A0A7R9BPA8_9CRUS|nr:unnamed protein product [Notodromas monacha]CAG0918888.1 unnamed protein product [Notodromas monacha]
MSNQQQLDIFVVVVVGRVGIAKDYLSKGTPPARFEREMTDKDVLDKLISNSTYDTSHAGGKKFHGKMKKAYAKKWALLGLILTLPQPTWKCVSGQPPVGQFTVAHLPVVKRQSVQPPASHWW